MTWSLSVYYGGNWLATSCVTGAHGSLDHIAVGRRRIYRLGELSLAVEMPLCLLLLFELSSQFCVDRSLYDGRLSATSGGGIGQQLLYCVSLRLCSLLANGRICVTSVRALLMLPMLRNWLRIARSLHSGRDSRRDHHQLL